MPVVSASALFVGLAGAAHSETPEQAARFEAAKKVPMAGCEDALTNSRLAGLDLDVTSPYDLFERRRHEHPHMVEFPPYSQCLQEAWSILHGLKAPAAAEPPRQAAPLAPSVGADLDLANGVSSYQGELYIAIDPNNPLHMTAGANTGYRDNTAGCYSPTGGTSGNYGTQAFFGSTDGGTTWVYHCAPWPASLTGGVSGAVAWYGSDPAMAYDHLGNSFASYMLVNQNSTGSAIGTAIVLAKSSDNGGSWTSVSTIVNHETVNGTFDDKNMMAIDTSSGKTFSHTGRIYVIFDTNNVEKVAYSDSPYASWTTVNVDTGGDIGGNLTVAADGTVWAAWNRYSQTGGVGAGDKLYVKKSTDGGATWTAPHTNPLLTHNLASFGSNNAPPAQDQRGINAFPTIDIDRNPASAYYGRLYIVYNDFPSGTGSGSNLNVYLIRSTDSGANWSTQLLVNDDGGSGTQFFPWMNVDQSDGAVHISWLDTRVDPANSRQTQTYGTRSVDGGTSVEANLLLEDNGANFVNAVNYSAESSPPNTNRDLNQYGDYSGMAALNRIAHPLWTDSRNFYPTNNAKREDAATSLVTFCTAPTGVATPTLSCNGSAIRLTWAAPATWGTNATGGTYTVTRFTDAACTLNATVLSTNATSPYDDATAVAGTTYYYEVTATNNCPGTALTKMSTASTCSAGKAATATPVAGNNGPICVGSTLNLTTPTVAGATYAWTGPNGFTSTSQNPSIGAATTAATGTYSVTVTAAGCASAAGTTTATVSALPSTPTAGNDGPICAGAALNLSTPTIAGATYAWTGPNGFTAATQNPTILAATTAATGTYSVRVTVGGCQSAAGTTAATVNADTAAPVVTAPGPVAIDQTICCGVFGGVTPAGSATLNTFVGAGSATDDCAASPTKLTAQVAGVNVTSATCFEAGASSVTFRFQDTAGKIGTATSTATVRMFGDLNIDAVVDPSDMVVMRAYFNFAVTPGTAPFSASLNMADLTHDASVDPSDMVLMRSYLNFAVTCLAP